MGVKLNLKLNLRTSLPLVLDMSKPSDSSPVDVIRLLVECRVLLNSRLAAMVKGVVLQVGKQESNLLASIIPSAVVLLCWSEETFPVDARDRLFMTCARLCQACHWQRNFCRCKKSRELSLGPREWLLGSQPQRSLQNCIDIVRLSWGELTFYNIQCFLLEQDTSFHCCDFQDTILIVIVHIQC